MALLNQFVLKKYMALILVGCLSVITFFTVTVYYGFVYGILGFLVALIISVFLGSLLLKNPFQDVLEGQGVLFIDMSSTGILQPTIFYVQDEYLRGKLHGSALEDVFDRNAIHHLSFPKKASKMAYFVPGEAAAPGKAEVPPVLRFDFHKEDFNNSRFQLYHLPVVLYNHQLKSVLTKDFFAVKETQAFAKHNILYMNRKVQELVSSLLNFGRYVVEQTKPKGNFLQSKWVWIIAIVAFAVMAVIFAPSIINTVSGFSGNAGAAVSTASSAVKVP